MSECIQKYDNRGNRIYRRWGDGFECWYKYDYNDNLIYSTSTNGIEEWFKYENKERILITKQEFKRIERTKLYLNNKKINRFEIMDI